ncbi:hypothetical protein CKO42_18345 [Lamprobacter modestohalophilus]|uniref:ISKra4 family transposase n=1 Tax=Lamprobacter modestohalophilus TaxID=1064514 RepID=A0A9X0WB88_9GAMM|nr:ISKra4 family transposase [Lamprobacter modestohalophilus]MBK1620363.1 hypothetical protein [Lamprobacter modestohalophilus]MCF7977772.1 ISKra4 family transposase [Chromatiaceae bacterium]MCF7995625.1 ISKra4 family transposase [Chromatiaceae bacterium]MCF8017473.1 ISKra4 family transposase [Chromatiaceae bacterium]
MFSLHTSTLTSHGPQLIEQMQELVNFVEASLEDRRATHEVEQGLWRGVLALGHSLLGAFFAASGDGDVGEEHLTEQGRVLKRLAPRTRPYRSVFGEFQLERFVYGQREGQAIELIPLDARLKLPETCTSFLLQSWNEQLMIEQPYAQTNDLLERVLEVRQSVQTLERQQAGLSTSVDAFWAQQPPPTPASAETLVVNTVDGKGVAMRASETQGVGGKKKMALLGSVYSIAPFVRTPDAVLEALFAEKTSALKRPPTARPKPLHKAVRAGLIRDAEDHSGEQTRMIFAWLQQQNRLRNPDGAQHTVVLIDGQRSLWQAAATYLPGEDVTEILDIIHVAGYLWEAAEVLEDTQEQRRAWVKTALGQVLHGQVADVLADLDAQRKPRRGRARKRLDSVYTYLDGNRHRMAYDAYLEAGFPIATGVIEGACRHLVKDRMERSGMRWTVPGAHAMLQLRSVALSELWGPFMDFRIHSELTRLYGDQAANDDQALPIAA